mgnify:CR=1 FL=1
MRLGPDIPRRRPAENIVPMINIVFLLLVFFLLTATIAPPDPVETTLPSVAPRDAAPVDGRDDRVVHVTAAGLVVHGAQAVSRDDAAGPGGLLDALARQQEQDGGANGPLVLRADAALDAALFARLLGALGAAGIGAVEVAVLPDGVAP